MASLQKMHGKKTCTRVTEIRSPILPYTKSHCMFEHAIAIAKGGPKPAKDVLSLGSHLSTCNPKMHSQAWDSPNKWDTHFLKDKRWSSLALQNPLCCSSQELVLTRTTTTCTDTCSGSRMGARKCMAKATRRCRMEIKFLPWMAAGNKANEASERTLRCYFKQTALGGKGSEKYFWSTQYFYPSSSFS